METALFIMIGVVISTTITLITNFRREQKRQRALYNDRLHQLQVFYKRRRDILRKAVFQSAAVNGLILKIHNDGSKLTESKTWYSSVVIEWPTNIKVSAIDSWQNIPVDESYRKLIRELQHQSCVFVDIEEYHGQLLYRTYKALDVKGSIVMSLYSDERYFYYLSFPVRDSVESLTDYSEFHIYQMAQIHLQRLYERHHKLNTLELDWYFPDNP